ncbi:MAG: hypothetical protein ACSI46_27695 [Gloeotrichia echinulata DVL01]|nr:hypothetical protein [Gloeotrichia echinulata DEX184]
MGITRLKQHSIIHCDRTSNTKAIALPNPQTDVEDGRSCSPSPNPNSDRLYQTSNRPSPHKQAMSTTGYAYALP